MKETKILLSGKWQNELPGFHVLGSNIIINFSGKKSKINLKKNIIDVENLSYTLPNAINNKNTPTTKFCKQCKSPFIEGYWDGFLPLFLLDASKRSILVSELNDTHNDVVYFCPKCNYISHPNKLFEIFDGDATVVEKKVKDQMLASKIYNSSLKKGAITGGLMVSSCFLIKFIINIFSMGFPSIYRLLYEIFIISFSFLIGLPFGALAGVLFGRIKNASKDLPPY